MGGDQLLDRILLTCFMMYDYGRCNSIKEALCQSEGIDESQSDAFAELGDESPLFRSVSILRAWPLRPIIIIIDIQHKSGTNDDEVPRS